MVQCIIKIFNSAVLKTKLREEQNMFNSKLLLQTLNERQNFNYNVNFSKLFFDVRRTRDHKGLADGMMFWMLTLALYYKL